MDRAPRHHTDDPEHLEQRHASSRGRCCPGSGTAAWRLAGRFLGRLPADPRCKLCASPFKGPFAPALRLVGKGPWPRNPRYCAWCLKDMIRHRGGAEIESSFLFADVRDSTTMAETMPPGEFQALMQGFFHAATEVLVRHDAIVDKFVGDEVIGLFIPLLTAERHAERAVAAGQDLLATTGAEHGVPVAADRRGGEHRSCLRRNGGGWRSRRLHRHG